MASGSHVNSSDPSSIVLTEESFLVGTESALPESPFEYLADPQIHVEIPNEANSLGINDGQFEESAALPGSWSSRPSTDMGSYENQYPQPEISYPQMLYPPQPAPIQIFVSGGCLMQLMNPALTLTPQPVPEMTQLGSSIHPLGAGFGGPETLLPFAPCSLHNLETTSITYPGPEQLCNDDSFPSLPLSSGISSNFDYLPMGTRQCEESVIDDGFQFGRLSETGPQQQELRNTLTPLEPVLSSIAVESQQDGGITVACHSNIVDPSKFYAVDGEDTSTPKFGRGRIYKCSEFECQKSFGFSKDLKRHLGSVHQKDGRGYSCRCGHKDKRKDNFRRHFMKCKRQVEERYHCRCAAQVVTHNEMVAHLAWCKPDKRGRPKKSESESADSVDNIENSTIHLTENGQPGVS